MITYECVTTLLRTCFPPYGDAPEWRCGFAGPRYRDEYERPRPESGIWLHTRLNTYSDFASNWGHLGGQDTNAMRTFLGLWPKPVTPIVLRQGAGTTISVSATWTNPLSWTRYGDWKPPDWNEQTQGPFHQPWPWRDCRPYERCHGYPWTEPIGPHPNWWAAECPACENESLHQIGSRYVDSAFVSLHVLNRSVLCAAAKTHGPNALRVGGTIRADVTLMIAGHTSSADFLYRAALAMAGLEDMPYTDWRICGTEADVSAWRPDQQWTPELACTTLAPAPAWSMREYESVPFVHPAAYVSGIVLSPVGEQRTVRGIVVIGSHDGTDRILFWVPIAAQTIGQATTVSVEYRLTGVVDAV